MDLYTKIFCNGKRDLTCKFLGETSRLPEQLLEMRLAVQNSLHGGVATHL